MRDHNRGALVKNMVERRQLQNWNRPLGPIGPHNVQLARGSSRSVWDTHVPAVLLLSLSCLALLGGGCLFPIRRRRRRRQANNAEAHNDDVWAASPARDESERDWTESARSARSRDDQVSPELEALDIADIKRRKEQLSSGSMFQMKRDWLSRELAERRQGKGLIDEEDEVESGAIQVVVRRDQVFQDSYLQFTKLGQDSLRKALSVHFIGEVGRDDGGVTRDWYSALSREIFNPSYALFTASASDNYTYQINPNSGVNPEHLDFFHFVGIVVGKALQDKCLLDAHFTRPFYRRLLDKPVALEDIATVDLELYQGLTWILENDLTEVDLGLTFATSRESFGAVEEIELKPGGADIALTEENKGEYVDHLVRWRLVDGVEPQFDALRSGLARIVDLHLLQHFDEVELEWLIGGLPLIDAADWRRNTVYKAGYSDTRDCLSVQWFWQLVEVWDQEMRARLLQFVTGSSKVPFPEGFKGLRGSDGPRRFHIVRVSDITRLPQAHTCFNELILPDYESLEILSNNLLTAIFETGNQFQLR